MPTPIVHARPLEISAYAPYGVIVAAGSEADANDANHGTAKVWDAIATLVNARGEKATAKASLLRCQPHLESTLPVRWLERHPDSTQMFVPIRASRYLITVAHGTDAPDLTTLASFVVDGGQAITYAPGTWHHPLVALDVETDFVNVIFSDGTPRDCDERSFATPPVEIAIPPRAR